MSEVNLLKSNLGRVSYTNVIDTSFTQLSQPTLSSPSFNLPTIPEFFQDYEAIFFEIPKTGENSHTTLIETSTQYLGFQPISEEVEALQQEITILRQQLLDTRQQLSQISNTIVDQIDTISQTNNS